MPRLISPETRQKISESLKIYHEIKKAPSPEEQRSKMFIDGFKEATGIEVIIRKYDRVVTEEKNAQSRTEIQNNAQEESK
jgi:hypothetical protein